VSFGNISVELELNDRGFTHRIRRAGATVKALSGNFDSLGGKVAKTEKKLHGILPTLRDIAIIGASTRTVIHSLNDAFIGWTMGIVKSNAEIERMTVLMQGLSNATTFEGKVLEAANEVDVLFEKAQRAPFAINELSNSFVKLKTAGLKDVMGNLNSLTDAIANFGGNNETLHRATVAIQQMSSKGVVSMEELRQQLGEAVPSAIQSMAVGMEMSVGKLVEAISSGAVKAKPAIELMMLEFEKSMAGSAERMMDTWNGMVSQLSTKWVMFQKKVGDAGFFDSAKDGLQGLIDILDTEEALLFAKNLGEGLDAVVRGSVNLVNYLMENQQSISNFFTPLINGASALMDVIKDNGDVILTIAKFSAGLFAASSIAKVAVAMAGGLAAGFATLSGKIRIAAGAITLMTPVLATVTVGTATTTAAVTGLSAAMTVLGGPVGIVTGLIAAGAYAWYEYSSAAQRAEQASKDAVEAGKLADKDKDTGVVSKVQIYDNMSGVSNIRDQIRERISLIAELNAEEEKAVANEKKYSMSRIGFGGAVLDAERKVRAERIAQYEQEIKNLTENVEVGERGIVASTIAVVNEGAKKIASARFKALSSGVSALSSKYSAGLDAAKAIQREELLAIKETGKSEIEIRDKFKETVRRLSQERFDEEIVMIDRQIAQVKSVINGFGNDETGSLGVKIVDQEAIEKNGKAALELLRNQKLRLELELKSNIAGDGDITKRIQIETNITEINKKIQSQMSLIGLAASKIKDIYQFILRNADKDAGLPEIQRAKALILLAQQLEKAKASAQDKKIKSSKGSDDSGAITEGTKKAKNEISALISLLNSADSKFAKLKSRNDSFGKSNGYLEQTRQKVANINRDITDLIPGFDKLSIALKKVKITALLTKTAEAIEAENKISAFTGKINKLNKATKLMEASIKNLAGEDIEFSWVAEERQKMIDLGDDIGIVDEQLAKLKIGGSVDTAWANKLRTELLLLGKTAGETARIIAQIRAGDGKRSFAKVKQELVVAKSVKKSLKEQIGLKQKISILNTKGHGNPIAEYKAETAAIMEAYAAKLLLGENVKSVKDLSDDGKASIELEKARLSAKHMADIREQSRVGKIAHDRKMFDTGIQMVRDSVDKEINILKKRKKWDIEDANSQIKDKGLLAEKLLQIQQQYVSDLALIEYNHRDPMLKMLDDWQDTTDKMSEAGVAFSEGFADTLADGILGGEMNFKSLVASFAKSMLQMEIKAATSSLWSMLSGEGGGDSSKSDSLLVKGAGFFGNLFGDKSKADAKGTVGKDVAGKGVAGAVASVAGIKTKSGLSPKSAVGVATNSSSLSSLSTQLTTISGELVTQTGILREISTAVAQAAGAQDGEGIAGIVGNKGSKKAGVDSAEKKVAESAKDVTENTDDIFSGGFTEVVGKVSDKVVGGFSTIVDTAGGILNGGFSGIVSSIQGLLGGGGSGAMGAIGAVGKLIGSFFADGGTMNAYANGGIEGAKKTTASQMKRGGVAKQPRTALFGESTMPEAFIPMVDGRTIPVTVTEAANGVISAQIPLPSGEILATTVSMPDGVSKNVGGGDSSKKKVSAFANGGTMNSGKSFSAFAQGGVMSESVESDVGNNVTNTIADFSTLVKSLDGVSTSLNQISVGIAEIPTPTDVSTASIPNINSESMVNAGSVGASESRESTSEKPVTVNLINQSGHEQQASVNKKSADPEKMVLDIVLSAMSKPGRFSGGMKGAMKK